MTIRCIDGSLPRHLLSIFTQFTLSIHQFILVESNCEVVGPYGICTLYRSVNVNLA